jgi:nitroreductase
MEKPAVTEKELHPVIRKRWSPRSFDAGRVVEEEKIQRFLEAARWAPSSFNEQPWRYVVGIKGGDAWKGIFETLVEFNQQWAVNANVLVMTLGKKTLSRNGKPNGTFRYDAGGSVAYMTMQAVSDGLMTHQMGGFSKEKAMETFGFPDDLEPLTVMAIGYQDAPEKLIDAGMRESETAARQRRSVTESLFRADF